MVTTQSITMGANNPFEGGGSGGNGGNGGNGYVRAVAQEHKEAQKRTFGSELGAGSVNFYPDLARAPLETVLDRELLVLDAMIVEDFETQYGIGDFALLRLSDEATGEEFTTICGGRVVVRKVRKALAQRLLPLYGTIVLREGGAHGRYYDIV